MLIYRVREWDRRFENNRTRELKKLTWVPMPNRHDGYGYRSLIEGHQNGTAHYGVWAVICQVASKCDPRGTLLRDGCEPHTFESLSLMTGIPVALIREAVTRLLAIKWIECIERPDKDLESIPQEPAIIPHLPAPASQNPVPEWNGREGNGREERPAPGVVFSYALKEGISEFEARRFIDYYESVGWVIGEHKLPIVDWRAALRRWRTTEVADAQRRPAGILTPEEGERIMQDEERRLKAAMGK